MEHPYSFDNHKTPQYLYLVDENGDLPKNIVIMKTETLTQDMHNYGFRDFNIHHNMNYSKYDNRKYMALLNRQSIDLINDYYRRDFEMFGYDLREP